MRRDRRRRPLRSVLPITVGALLAAITAPAPASAAVTAVSIGSFNQPVYVTSTATSPELLFVVERRGVIRVLDDAILLAQPFLDISALVKAVPDQGAGGEQGLLSMAFAPDYADSGLFYVYYTNNDGDIEIDEFRVSAANPARALPGSRRTVIVIPHREAANHNGGQLLSAPTTASSSTSPPATAAPGSARTPAISMSCSAR